MKRFSYGILLSLNLISVAALLFSYLAPLINPSKFFLPTLFGLAYPFLLIVNLIFLFYWIIRLKKELLLSLLVILMGWSHLNNLLPLSGKNHEISAEADPGRMFKVLSYNVRGFDCYKWSEDPNTRNEMFKFLQAEAPDIICFQEYYASSKKGERQSDIARELSQLPQSSIYFTTDPKNKSGFGIATYSRFPIIKRSRIPFNSSNNASMYTDHLIFDDTIRVFNIHLQSIKFKQENYAFLDTARLKYTDEQLKGIRSIGSRLKTAFEMRADQATMIANYIKESPHPVIAMGDFNDTPNSYAYRKIKKGLDDAFRKSGRGFGNTYAGELPSFRIDHIMVGEPLQPYHFKRIKKKYSDHYPITTQLYIPGPPSAE
ncbi:MAG: endonuclease/exonuclease/phosphatase family protein [Bacteroides sp.]|nr:endonuclease/exonuclease/phosphatase family protein [Bacteroides sp.]